jgi:arylsulfatase A-like enzyme
MTGCYPKRVGLHNSVLRPQSNTGINPKEVTLAELLKTRGYATACIGKWHLGHRKPFLPTNNGFDYYYGVPYSNDMSTPNKAGKRGVPLMRNEEIIEHPTDQAALTERYTEEALKFIKEHKDGPFFLYLPHTMPHLPLHVSKRFIKKSKAGRYGDVIECIDWSTGKILDMLRELKLDKNTIVVFTSDNGPWLKFKWRSNGTLVGSALPLRDGKGTTYEGGVREPCVMWAPGLIPAGTVCSEVATAMDLYPTFAAMAGASLPKDRVIDGKDIQQLMKGIQNAKTPHKAFFYYSSKGEPEAVRSGKWKYRLAKPDRKKNRRGKSNGSGTSNTAFAELYDLEKDISEKNNCADQHPEIAAQLKNMLEQFDKDLTRNARPVGRI